jgi:hypothetical protein
MADATRMGGRLRAIWRVVVIVTMTADPADLTDLRTDRARIRGLPSLPSLPSEGPQTQPQLSPLQGA